MAGSNSLTGKPPVMTRLSGGVLVMLGEDDYDETGTLRYPGKLSMKYGRDKKDWLRLSYTDSVQLYKFMSQNRDFVNEQVRLETERMEVGEI